MRAASWRFDGDCSTPDARRPARRSVARTAGLAPLEGGGDEVAEQGMSLGGLRLELGVELDGQEPGMIAQLHDLDDRAVGAGAGGDQAVFLERLAIGSC